MTKIKKRPMCGKLVFLLPFAFCAASLSADDAVLSGGETDFQLDGTVHVFRAERKRQKENQLAEHRSLFDLSVE